MRLCQSFWSLSERHQSKTFAGAYMFSEGGGCDASYGSDFRNVFLLACAVGPLAVAAWIVLGADGMTPKTWQVRVGDRVATEVHSRRHALMRSWYGLCERAFGSAMRDGSR